MTLRTSSTSVFALLALGVSLAGCASDDAIDTTPSKSVDGTDVVELEGTRVIGAAHLYYDAPETVLTSTAARTFTFRGRGGAPLNVHVTGENASLSVTLYAHEEGETKWRVIGTGENPNAVTLEDKSTSARTYFLEVTAAPDKTIVVALKCSAETHDACAATQQPNDVCSGILPRAIPCEEGLFCNLIRNTCGYADQGGRCAKKPESCTQIEKPVCGCDDVTYPNECVAAAKGASIARDGECGDK